MNEFEVVLSYTFRVRAENWDEAKDLGHEGTYTLPNTIRHPQTDKRVELEIDIGEGFEVKNE